MSNVLPHIADAVHPRNSHTCTLQRTAVHPASCWQQCTMHAVDVQCKPVHFAISCPQCTPQARTVPPRARTMMLPHVLPTVHPASQTNAVRCIPRKRNVAAARVRAPAHAPGKRSRAVQRSRWRTVRAGGAGKETAVRALRCTTGGARSARAPQRTDWSPHERSERQCTLRTLFPRLPLSRPPQSPPCGPPWRRPALLFASAPAWPWDRPS